MDRTQRPPRHPLVYIVAGIVVGAILVFVHLTYAKELITPTVTVRAYDKDGKITQEQKIPVEDALAIIQNDYNSKFQALVQQLSAPSPQ